MNHKELREIKRSNYRSKHITEGETHGKDVA